MNVGEWGIVFRFSTGYNMSGSTALSLALTKPSGAVLTKTNPSVAVGAVPITTTLGLFAANQYVNYTFVNGDIDEAGVWSARLTYTDADRHLISDVAEFTVNE